MHLLRKFRPMIHIPMILGGLVLAVALAFVFGLFVMLLWNWLMPEIFGLTHITYWQAWGLVLLTHILFKSHAHGKHDHDDEEHEKWKGRFKSRLEKWTQGEEAEESAAPKSTEPKKPKKTE
ncbi:MAG: hypothetical protein JW822_05015 [Spirochaetales bacterium]|nr:hypothetical protein [Spirochaetales bacterium]